ncbi:MAG: cyclic nucleotide-binding domain-containing protein [Betaproteobacteria bacterium]|nr:cyclic nucleotide-binding domain-containing protein [Betaproteobacteria bacterium]
MQRIMAKLIDSVALFYGLSQAELGELLANSDKRTFPGNTVILSEGSEGNFMYILVEGEVAIVKGKSQILAKLASGDCFGEMALVDSLSRCASVVSTVPCVLIRVSENAFSQKPAISAKLYRNIARQLSSRLRDSNAMISLGLKDHP